MAEYTVTIKNNTTGEANTHNVDVMFLVMHEVHKPDDECQANWIKANASKEAARSVLIGVSELRNRISKELLFRALRGDTEAVKNADPGSLEDALRSIFNK